MTIWGFNGIQNITACKIRKEKKKEKNAILKKPFLLCSLPVLLFLKGSCKQTQQE